MTVLMTDRNELLFRELERELDGAARSAKTASAYHQALLSLQRYLAAAGLDTGLLTVGKDEVVGWLCALRETGGRRGEGAAKDTMVSYFTSARRFYAWTVSEGMLEASPMARVMAPAPSGKPVPIPAAADVRKLLAVCEADKSPAGLRDTAIIRLFLEAPGCPRLSEAALLTLDRLDMKTDYVTVIGKGGKWRGFPLCAKTARALSRWLRARDTFRQAPYTDRVFIGPKGPLLPDSLHKIVKRRCAQAGIPPIHPHQLRHFGTDAAKRAGMAEEDIMTANGWSTTRMLARYGAAAAEQRAAAASRRLSLGNQL
jgi:site-specific recombinase XerD